MSYPPRVAFDEYGRATCAAHGRDHCNVCCMSWTSYNEEVDANPSDRDVGVFLPDRSLVEWHVKMKARMPRVFTEDAGKVFGDDPRQHPYGTKLLAHFDDDPNKPMNATVVGSRWKKDDFGGFPGMEPTFADGLEPVYVILIGGELSQIGLMDAHMGEDGGWKVVGCDPVVNPRFDKLALAHQNTSQSDRLGEAQQFDEDYEDSEEDEEADDSGNGYPGITFDEYCRTFCSAHNLARCHICCMDFTDDNRLIDENSCDRDVGVVVPDQLLEDWYSRMALKMPQIYRENESIFGRDSAQHRYGTGLKHSGMNMQSTVLGSRWIKDGLNQCVDGRIPAYVVLIDGELSTIEMAEAHDQAEWKVVGHNSEVNARLDALARAHQSTGSDGRNKTLNESAGESSEDEDDAGIEQRLSRLRLNALKRLDGVDPPLKPWVTSVHGPFLVQFFMHSFSSSERDHIVNYERQSSSEDIGGSAELLAERIKSFPIEASLLQPKEINFHVRLLLAKAVAYFVSDRYGAVIISNKRCTKFQAVELNHCQRSQNGVPVIEIAYALDPEGAQRANEYLRDEKIKEMELPNELAVALEEHFLNSVSNDGLNDIGSGLLYHVGVLAPLKSNTTELVTTFNDGSMPDVNFGVELELSCASGNYQEKIALSIAKHAQVDVRIARPGKGKGGFGGGKGGGSFSGFSLKGGSKSAGTDDAKEGHSKWKIVYDRSIQPNPQNTQSLMFELVTPILSGVQGLDALSSTVTVMRDVASVRVNDSMGLHVHVEAKEDMYSLDDMKSICQQFLIYEDTVDSFLPVHRRTGSEKSHSYFESNLLSVMLQHETLDGAIQGVSSCETREELYWLMNPGLRERYHKLNLQNLATGRQPTLEFRQHHSTTKTDEILAWVRFCVLFVTNASKLPLVTVCNTAGDKDAMFDALFEHIIRCPVLKEYYSRKRMVYQEDSKAKDAGKSCATRVHQTVSAQNSRKRAFDHNGEVAPTTETWTCDCCDKVSSKKLPSCARCKKVFYCDRDCQAAAWKAHKKRCVPLEQKPKSASLTWAQVEAHNGNTVTGKVLEVRAVLDQSAMRQVVLCKDRAGVARRIAAYNNARHIPGLREGSILRWKNPRFHYFMDGSSGARIEETDLLNIKVINN